MQNFLEKTADGRIAVHAALYDLLIDGHQIAVNIENTTFAILDIRTAVPQTNDDDTGFIPDEEPSLPILSEVIENASDTEFVFTNQSSLWQKIYRLKCDYLHFFFTVTVKGRGRVDSVNYFAGDGKLGSVYEFSEGYQPCQSWYDREKYSFLASEDCHRWSVLMVPPMFCYAFRCEGLTKRLGLGLVAKRGEHNFNAFDYHVRHRDFQSGFYLSTDQSGHTVVGSDDSEGEWTSPMIFGCSGDNETDIFKSYADYYYMSGIAKPYRFPDGVTSRPRFWYGPILCGWIDQCLTAAEKNENPTSYATEAHYEDLLKRAAHFGLKPCTLIIDDKWQKEYATDFADTERFPDMRGFIDRRHAEGISTLLWFKLWDAEGWKGATLTADNGSVRYDPSDPAFLQLLDSVLYRLLSADEGCYNCDGFKLDFAFFLPIGRKVHAYSGKYGVELLYDLMEAIYTRAKKVKPTALINASPCHPYFASVCDQARLHDYNYANRDNREDLQNRAGFYDIAFPGILIDTDNAGFCSRRDSLRWLYSQQFVGVPVLYAVKGSKSCPIQDSDFFAIAQLWDEYSKKIDATLG